MLIPVTSSLNVTRKATAVEFTVGVFGLNRLIESTTGPVLSTVKVALGALAGAPFPAPSVAVPAANEIPKVPSPLILESVTNLDTPAPLTLTVAFAVPVLLSVTSAARKRARIEVEV